MFPSHAIVLRPSDDMISLKPLIAHCTMHSEVKRIFCPIMCCFEKNYFGLKIQSLTKCLFLFCFILGQPYLILTNCPAL